MYKLTAQDMDQLCSNGANWGEWARVQQDEDGRWDVMGETGEEINYDFKHAHWLEDNWANVVLAKMFLDQEGYTYQVLYDNADNTSGWWFERLHHVSERISATAEGRVALLELAEMLRRQNTGYVILTDFSRIR
jgi:hypothetical protein